MARSTRTLLALGGMILLAGCNGGSSSSATNKGLSPIATLGEKIFHDVNLSASGQLACATCHVETSGLANADGQAVASGGPGMNLPGLRNTPSLAYTALTPAFSLTGDGPSGGFFRDGRAASLIEQAQGPFLNPFEMANADAAAVITRLRTRPYATDFTAIFGPNVLNTPEVALARMGAAIAAYEKEDTAFHAFNSKYDYWQSGRAELTRQELRGLALYNSPKAGNCAACHPSTSADGVTPPLFTDFSYDNLGVPRNTALAANDDHTTLPYVPANGTDGVHRYYDLGVCGPLRSDIGGNNANTGFCGQFKVPTLRNIALTAPYFHNGGFTNLRDALSFYVTRDTDPSRWYPATAAGKVTKFDDLPAIYGGQFVVDINDPQSDAGYVGNVNTGEVPYNRRLGGQPALSPDEVDDVIAFLCTLSDGYDPANPAGYATPQQCIDVQKP